MNRHPDYINYSNSPPTGDNLKRIENNNNNNNNNNEILNPDYHVRRLYKIDWKVCFMKYCYNNNKMAEYHVFVEDDSFVCTENLLYQVSLLYNKSINNKVLVDIVDIVDKIIKF